MLLFLPFILLNAILFFALKKNAILIEQQVTFAYPFFKFNLYCIFPITIYTPYNPSPQQSPHWCPCPWVLFPFCSIPPPPNFLTVTCQLSFCPPYFYLKFRLFRLSCVCAQICEAVEYLQRENPGEHLEFLSSPRTNFLLHMRF